MKIELHKHFVSGRSKIYLFEVDRANDDRESKSDFQRKAVSECFQLIFPDEKCEVGHNEGGAPFLNGKKDVFISISHSDKWYAIQVSEINNVGIDVQVTNKNMIKGKSYFVNSHEDELANSNNRLHIIWAAKEAIYKLFKGEVANFKDAITVQSIEKKGITVVYNEKKIECSYLLENDKVLVYVN